MATSPFRGADDPQYTPVIEDLIERVTKLEEIVRTLIGHQHQYYLGHYTPTLEKVGHDTTRPIGMSGTKV